MDSVSVYRGRRVPVTGGTAGLGLALVRELVRRGAQVAFVARGRDHVEQVARDFPGTHGIVGDVARQDDIYPIALQALGELGGLDLLINNASALGPGVASPARRHRLRGSRARVCDQPSRSFSTDQSGARRAGGIGPERGGAAVVNISSDAAVHAYPSWGAYSASKAALRHLTSIWDAEVEADGVRLLSIDPGDMDTALHAQAVPDADRSALKKPADAAVDVLDAIALAMPVAGGRAS